jgi:ribosomal peptide maturation radical SAM protein 1
VTVSELRCPPPPADVAEAIAASVRDAVSDRALAGTPKEERRFLVEHVRDLTKDVDCVIVVPPFASAMLPPLGPHVLQAVAKTEGMMVRVLYANLIFASMLDISAYQVLCEMHSEQFATSEAEEDAGPRTASARAKPNLVGERLFARLAHGLPRFGAKSMDATVSLPERLLAAESVTDSLCKIFAEGIVAGGCRVIGFSTSFQQTNASLSMVRALRRANCSIHILFGGANCEGPMGAAMLALAADSIDFVLSGESEETFPQVLRAILDGRPPRERLIEGRPCLNLDALPVPDFVDYFLQLRTLFPHLDPRESWITYETSRGCWWGQKHHCTFCGLNGQGMTYRAKSPDKVIVDLKALLDHVPTSSIAMADNIMPHAYHSTLVPRLAECKFPAKLFYEQKANLRLRQVKHLYDAGITSIQPGIEALSTDLLRRVKKGVTGNQNLALLRYARIIGMHVAWNLLTEIPGDAASDFEWMLRVIPLLHHLEPPSGASPLSIDRFSPYFEDPVHYGIARPRPWPAYRDIFPTDANVADLAYHFEGDYRSGSRESPQLLTALDAAVAHWRRPWQSTGQPLPALMIAALDSDNFCLLDTRVEGRSRVRFLKLDQARAALLAGPLDHPLSKWAIDEGLAIALDGRCIPLATASYEIMSQFEALSLVSVTA